MENRYVISETLYLDWARHPMQPKRFAAVFRVVWLALFAFCVVMAALTAYRGDFVFAAIYGLLLLFSFYRVILRQRILLKRQFRQLLRLQKADEWLRIVQFGDAITVVDGSARMDFPYDDLTEMREQGDYWCLLFPESITIRVKKGAFTQNGAALPDTAALAQLQEKAPGASGPK